VSTESEGPYVTSFFRNPDVVWAGIELSLDAVGYEITDSNRPDGKIRAVSGTGGEGPEIVLLIDQVVRTEDQVFVYVKPRFGDADSPATPAQLEAAARDFLAVLDRKMSG
jgi:hypothetical protein